MKDSDVGHPSSNSLELRQMKNPRLSPFSNRNQPNSKWIDNDFPLSARIGLLHLINNAIDNCYLSNWIIIAKELGRIHRDILPNYNITLVKDINEAKLDSERLLRQIHWQKLYDFCERLFSHLTNDIAFIKHDTEVLITKSDAQEYLTNEIQLLFDEENLGYEFKDGFVQRRGNLHTINLINKAEKTLSEQRLNAARMHFSKALRNFRDRTKPDYENTVKEAVCAIEAAAKELFPNAKSKTLGDFITWATHRNDCLFPKTIGQTFTGLYAFRNSGEGVSHGATSGDAVTSELSEYVLGIAASQIILLSDLAKNDFEPPF